MLRLVLMRALLWHDSSLGADVGFDPRCRFDSAGVGVSLLCMVDAFVIAAVAVVDVKSEDDAENLSPVLGFCDRGE